MTQILKPNNPQVRALQSLRAYRHKKLGNKAIVKLPSGIGKTHLAVFDSIKSKSKTILYIIHRIEILEQTIEAFKHGRGLKDSQIGRVTQGRKEFEKQFVFATIQTLSRPENLEILSKYEFDYAIVDEAHHVAAKSYVKTLEKLHYGFLLGLTATPYRHDMKNILQYFDNNLVFEMELKDAIERRELVSFIYRVFKDNIDWSDIRYDGHKYSEKDLNKKLLIKERDDKILKEVDEWLGPDKQVIAFCATVPHVERMVSLFNSHGIKAAGVTNRTNKLSRMEINEAFRNKEYRVLFTRDIYNEGVDFPFVQGVLFLRPTESETVFFQQLGRGLRLAPGKDEVTVLDFVSNDHNAYKIPKWLEFTEVKFQSISKKELDVKPTYEYTPRARVYFDHELKEIFAERSVTREQLIDDYRNVEKRKGRKPILNDFNGINRMSKYTIDQVRKVFNDWNGFQLYMGEVPHRYREIEKEAMDANWLALRDKLGRAPKYVELRRPHSKFVASTYRDRYGSYSAYLRRMGQEVPDRTRLERPSNMHCCDCGSNTISTSTGGRSGWYIADRENKKWRCATCYKRIWKRMTAGTRPWSDYINLVKHPSDAHCDDCGSRISTGGKWHRKYKDRYDKWRCNKCEGTAKRRGKGIIPRIQRPSDVSCFDCGSTETRQRRSNGLPLWRFDAENRRWRCATCYDRYNYRKKRDQLKK